MTGSDLFQNPQYRRLLLGQAVSQIGTSFSYIAVMAKFFELSGSADGWAYLAAVKVLPFVLFGVLLGYLTDKCNRKAIIFASDFCRFLLYIAIAFCQDLNLFYGLVFLSSMFEAAYLPTYKSFVTDILKKNSLLGANSIEETVRSTLAILGVALSGVLIGWVGVKTCFLLDAATYLFSALNILTIPGLRAIAQGAHEAPENPEGQEPLLKQVLRGLSEIKSRHEIHYPLFLWTFIVLIVAYEAPLFFPLAVEKGWDGAAAVGYMYAAVSLGSFLSSLYLLRTGNSPVKDLAMVSLVIFIDATVLWGIIQIPVYSVALSIAFLLGVTETLFRTYAVTEVQKNIPKETVGRVFSCVSTLQEPMKILAILAAGSLVQGFSAITAFNSAIGMEYVVGILTGVWVLEKAVRKRFSKQFLIR